MLAIPEPLVVPEPLKLYLIVYPSLKQIKEYGDLYEQGKAKFKERNAMLEEHREKILQEIKTQKKYLKMVEAKIKMKI